MQSLFLNAEGRRGSAEVPQRLFYKKEFVVKEGAKEGARDV
jgi:hypothetical protein